MARSFSKSALASASSGAPSPGGVFCAFSLFERLPAPLDFFSGAMP
jgi:hypothetical protein